MDILESSEDHSRMQRLKGVLSAWLIFPVFAYVLNSS